MSAHAIATAIEQEVSAFRNLRFRDQAEYLEAKDAHCARIRSLVRQLRPKIGVPEMLSFGTGRRTFGGRSFEVVAKIPRKLAERSASRGRQSA
ncbi:hypothetical protein GGR33_004635 [Methylobacterium brachythecii]|uniref:Uncharacterized protein n=2 Tax=Methylobacterium brachythecii TaxID=1176177 RepID=A0A7W6F926_9HYPH|nr:hypothetical protein [Methylobacterium brachythecii]MBB3905107.1 hypothetical protein [Methylobacterium brachythecii]GLS44384.1 hypothetical protein GCM10007884_23720 [Methylobacterium brachythecii]